VQADLRSRYSAERAHLVSIAQKLLHTVQEQCRSEAGFVFASHRVKEVESFVEKAQKIDKSTGTLRYPEPLLDIHDQIGCRVIVRGTPHVSPIRRILERRFDAYDIDPKQPEDPGLFGYAALHMESPIPEGLLGRRPRVETTRFEIQIATLYQYAWTEMEHGNYKSGLPPLSFEGRRLIAAAAALSLTADELFERVVAVQTPSRSGHAPQTRKRQPQTKGSRGRGH
jgi:ppGpp synthetase/RelA/SpoT-type nucleotidyltranferase